MNANIVHNLPIPGSGCNSIRVASSSVALIVEYEYFEQMLALIGGIRFDGLIAFRFRNERHSAGYSKGSYDTLVVIEDSSWLRELRLIEPTGTRPSVNDARHYAMFFDSNGYLQVIARSFSMMEPRQGLLDDL